VRIRLLAVGRRPPRWAEAAFRDYAGRLPAALKLEAPLLPLAKGHGNDTARAVADEGARLRGALGPRDQVIALEESGEAWSTAALADRLGRWEAAGDDVALLVGGPDGLDASCRERAGATWSLSRLTLPHALVRVVVAEQLYRAWSLNHGHPYHRG